MGGLGLGWPEAEMVFDDLPKGTGGTHDFSSLHPSCIRPSLLAYTTRASKQTGKATSAFFKLDARARHCEYLYNLLGFAFKDRHKVQIFK